MASTRANPLVRFLAPCALVLAVATAGAQSRRARGSVVEATTGRPIPGAVVTVLDSAGNVLTRNLADEDGVFSVPLADGAARLRVIRIGFRPREVPVPPPDADGLARTDVGLAMIPTLLEPARVRAKECPKRADAEQAYGLWEQARAGLLAGVVAREQKPASLVRIAYRQVMRDGSGQIASQTIVLDSVDRVARSYQAPFDANRFLRNGFSDDSAGRKYFSAPDAEVLLDPTFGNGYCFRIADADRRRRNQVGLAFTPADRRAGRVDIDGTLWVDTVARAVRDIVFTYVSLELLAGRDRAGGTVAFHDMPNGVSFLDYWQLRLPGSTPDTSWRGSEVSRIRERQSMVASGGQVAHATWEDGARYDASLGSLVATAKTMSGAPATDRLLYLVQTTYSARTDSSGTLELTDLMPGPYLVAAREQRLAPLHMDSIPTTLAFVAARDSIVHAELVAPTLEEWVGARCRGSRPPPRGRATTDQAMILARVLSALKRPMADVDYVVEVATPVSRTGWSQVARGRTDADGMLQVCTTAVAPGQRIGIELRKGRDTLGRLEENLSADQLTVIPLLLKP